MSKRDAIRSINDGNGPPPTCARGCAEVRPVEAEALDPFTVRMVVVCPRCGRTETSIGDLREHVDNARTAEDFARDFVKIGSLPGRGAARRAPRSPGGSR